MTTDAGLNRRLRLLGLAAFASMAAMRWCDALLPVLAAEFGHTTGQVAVVVWAYAIAYGLMQLVYGPIGDRLGKYTVVSLATLACTAGVLASALAPTLGWLTVARVLTGAAAAGIIPLAMAWVGDQVPWEQRQPVLARMLGANVAGMIAGQWLAGLFADAIGWRLGFVALALVFVGAGLAMRAGVRGGADAASSAQAAASMAPAVGSLGRAREVLRSPHARAVLAVVAVEGALAKSALAFGPSHLHLRFGLSVSAAGAILTLFGLGGLIYSRNASRLLRRMQPLTMARAGGVVVGAAWVGVALAPAVAWTLPLCLAAGLGFYMIHNTLQALATQMVPAQRGTAVSLFASALFLGQSAGMGLASWLVDHGSTTVLLLAYGIGLAALGLVVHRAVRLPEAPPR